MNIFFLHHNPATCAAMHCDKHVVKMILESSQLLSTAHHVLASPVCEEVEFLSNLLKPTHENHPCALWVRDSSGNYLWLLHLLDSLHGEYHRRYGRVHALRHMQLNYLCKLPASIPSGNLTAPALAMPASAKVLTSSLLKRHSILSNKDGDGTYVSKMLSDVAPSFKFPEAIYAYRSYYITHKAHMLSYTETEVPAWCENVAVSKPAKKAASK